MIKDMKFKEKIKGEQLIAVLNQLLPGVPSKVFKKLKGDDMEKILQDFNEAQFVVELTINQVTQ